MEERHFWHLARNAWILRGLRRYGVQPPDSFLEIGCGSGVVARGLQQAGYQVTGVDTAEPLARKAAERCPSARFVVAELDAIPEQYQGPYAALGFFDVLEHLSDPARLLREALRFSQPGTLLIATVPAMQSAYSIIDELSGHKRRFDPGQASRLFEEVGLVDVAEYGIFRTTHIFQRMVRSWLPTRSPMDRGDGDEIMLRHFRTPPRPVNAAMGLLCGLERGIGLGMARNQSGGSLLVVGRG
jgi:SAM-dependent methyltransferase